MKQTKSRTCEGSSQGEVLDYMENHTGWLTSKHIADGLNLQSREKVAKFLNRLEKFNFVERQRIIGSNELEYRIKPSKETN